MNTLPAADLRRKIAGVCLIAAPVLLLGSTVLRFGFGRFFTWYLTMKLSFFFFAVGVLGLMHLLRGRADGSAHVGGGLALAGCLSGASIVTAAYILTKVAKLVPKEEAGSLFLTVANSPLPGFFFPVGLLVLAVALWRKKVVPAWAALLFAVGAVLFPVGRAAGLIWAVWACDVLLTVSLGAIGLMVLRWTVEEWSGSPAPGVAVAATEREAAVA